MTLDKAHHVTFARSRGADLNDELLTQPGGLPVGARTRDQQGQHDAPTKHRPAMNRLATAPDQNARGVYCGLFLGVTRGVT